MTEQMVAWQVLDAADYLHMEATAVWGAVVGDELVFTVTEGAEGDEFDDLDDEDLEEGPLEAPESNPSPTYRTYAVLTVDRDGFSGLEHLDGFGTLQAAQDSLAADLQAWKQMVEQES